MTGLPPLIPRQVLFGNPERTAPQLSPDGNHLAYLAPDDRNVLQVWLKGEGGAPDRVLTRDEKRGIRGFSWAFDGVHLLYHQDRDGDENFHLYAVEVATGATRDLTPHEGTRSGLLALSPDVPGSLLVTMNLRDRAAFDVHRVALSDGATVLVEENPGKPLPWIFPSLCDAKLNVRAAHVPLDDGGSELLVRESAGSAWKSIRRWPLEEIGGVAGMTRDGKTLYLIDSLGHNTTRLLARDMATGEEKVLAGDPGFDVNYVIHHPRTGVAQAVCFNRDRLEWEVLDSAIGEDIAAVTGFRRGNAWLGNRDLDDRRWVVGYEADDGPGWSFLYDRATRTFTPLFCDRPALDGLTLARMKPASFPSRDGTPLHGYLTLPPGVDPKGLPAVLDVHGGPWSRDTWGFRNDEQWLANRGYAVLQVNFRGSDGYGKEYLNAGNREWGGRMTEDVVDGARWLVREGIADRARIAIMGVSWGGYATLAGLAFHPAEFAAGVDQVGPSNLFTLFRTIPPYWASAVAMFRKRVGDLESDQDLLRAHSPLFSAQRIRAPLLIGQGANDPRVNRAESEQIVDAMRKAGLPVEYIVYADEGHGLARPENQLHFRARAEEFLARHLGGRCEPSSEVKGHSGSDG